MADYTNKGEYRSPNASKVFKNQKKSKPSDNLKETDILQDPEKEAQEEFKNVNYYKDNKLRNTLRILQAIPGKAGQLGRIALSIAGIGGGRMYH